MNNDRKNPRFNNNNLIYKYIYLLYKHQLPGGQIYILNRFGHKTLLYFNIPLKIPYSDAVPPDITTNYNT